MTSYCWWDDCYVAFVDGIDCVSVGGVVIGGIDYGGYTNSVCC